MIEIEDSDQHDNAIFQLDEPEAWTSVSARGYPSVARFLNDCPEFNLVAGYDTDTDFPAVGITVEGDPTDCVDAVAYKVVESGEVKFAHCIAEEQAPEVAVGHNLIVRIVTSEPTNSDAIPTAEQVAEALARLDRWLEVIITGKYAVRDHCALWGTTKVVCDRK